MDARREMKIFHGPSLASVSDIQKHEKQFKSTIHFQNRSSSGYLCFCANHPEVGYKNTTGMFLEENRVVFDNICGSSFIFAVLFIAMIMLFILILHGNQIQNEIKCGFGLHLKSSNHTRIPVHINPNGWLRCLLNQVFHLEGINETPLLIQSEGNLVR